jgi:hypothetical protein
LLNFRDRTPKRTDRAIKLFELLSYENELHTHTHTQEKYVRDAIILFDLIVPHVCSYIHDAPAMPLGTCVCKSLTSALSLNLREPVKIN